MVRSLKSLFRPTRTELAEAGKQLAEAIVLTASTRAQEAYTDAAVSNPGILDTMAVSAYAGKHWRDHLTETEAEALDNFNSLFDTQD